MSEVQAPKPHPIEIEFYSRKSTKAFQLVNNVDPNLALDAKRQWYQYDFPRPVYIFEVSVSATGYEAYNEIDFEVDHIDGTKYQQSVRGGEGKANVSIGKLASSVKFRPLEKVFSTPKLQSITVNGLTLDEFHAYEWAIKEHEKSLQSLKSREETLALAETEDKERADQRVVLDSEIGKSRAELDQLTKQASELRATIAGLTKEKSSIGEEVSGLEDQRLSLRRDVNSSQQQLQTLKNEIRLFPSEIAGFVKEGNRSILWYLGLSIPFIVVIYVVLSALFSGAIDLTQLWRKEESVDIWVVFLTRIPFVIIALAILEVCGFVVGRLISEILRINRQRLSLSKLSIVARDVSVAAAHGLDLSSDEIYENEVKLKMELLRGHMTEDLGTEFQYKGTLLQSALSTVVGAITGRSKGNGS